MHELDIVIGKDKIKNSQFNMSAKIHREKQVQRFQGYAKLQVGHKDEKIHQGVMGNESGGSEWVGRVKWEWSHLLMQVRVDLKFTPPPAPGELNLISQQVVLR